MLQVCASAVQSVIGALCAGGEFCNCTRMRIHTISNVTGIKFRLCFHAQLNSNQQTNEKLKLHADKRNAREIRKGCCEQPQCVEADEAHVYVVVSSLLHL